MEAKWNASDPRDWANESFTLAEAIGTKYCEKHGQSCDKPDGGVTIDANYLKVNEPIVKEQLQKAGVRLSKLLDTVFGD
jgi:hypothetical protein